MALFREDHCYEHRTPPANAGAGGIDDIASARQEDIAGATNYVQKALDAALAGKPVETKTSKPYGCSVKYK